MTDDPPLPTDPVAAAFDRLAGAMHAGPPQEARRHSPAKWLDRAVGSLIGAGVLLVLVSLYAALWHRS
jgi:hypothetical protein